MWEKEHFITRVQADGIMLSTPTGGSGDVRGVWGKGHCFITRVVQAEGHQRPLVGGGRGNIDGWMDGARRRGRRPLAGLIISSWTLGISKLCRGNKLEWKRVEKRAKEAL